MIGQAHKAVTFKSYFRWDVELMRYEVDHDLYDHGLKFGFGWQNTGDQVYLLTWSFGRRAYTLLAERK